MKDKNFKLGDIVELKTGSVQMTITKIYSENNTFIEATYWDKQEETFIEVEADYRCFKSIEY